MPIPGHAQTLWCSAGTHSQHAHLSWAASCPHQFPLTHPRELSPQKIQRQRPDLRIIISSATIEAERMAA